MKRVTKKKVVPTKVHRNRKGELPLPYEEAREYVVKNIASKGIDTRLKWEDYKEKLPANIPKHPQNVYAGEGWDGWINWFGRGKNNSEFMRWCYENKISANTIKKFTKLGKGTVVNTWKECRASDSTMALISAKLPEIAAESISIRIKKNDKNFTGLSEAKIQSLIKSLSLSEEQVKSLITKIYKPKK